MRRAGIFIIGLFAYIAAARAQQNYDASLIAKDLLPYAKSVIRDDEQNVEVQDLDNTIERHKLAVTVLNKNGDDDAVLVLSYNKAEVIKSVKGIIYNSFGKQISKFSESDFEQQNAWDGFSLFLDDKVKYYRPAVNEYPYTVVYDYEIKFKQTLDLPEWRPVREFGVAVEKSTFTITCKPDFNIKYQENNLPGKVVTGTDRDGKKTYSWSLNDKKAVKYEPMSPYIENYAPSVKLAPEKFSFYDLKGIYHNWNELGLWEYQNLVASRQQLPPETVQKVKALTQDITDPKLKAKKIYEYMQQKTHYVSIQVGVGGWQPFLASDVDKQNYGDCKALVNYTQALLNAVNIESYYCVVEAGRQYKISMPADFPHMMGNHIILCLPFKNDTTWADCTSQTIPFGYLGDFTDDRTVLAVTPEGGKLMHTPKYTAADNIENHHADFAINTDGVLSGSMNSVFKGTYYEDRDHLINESATEQNKILQRTYPINNLEIEHYDLKQDKSFDPSTTENIKLKARDYASLTDGKYYFMLNSIDRVESIPKQVTNRRNDVCITRGYTRSDEITYTIPDDYRMEKRPLYLSIDKPFGKFSATMVFSGEKLVYKRKFELIGGTYSKDTYQDVVDFFQSVEDADAYTVSLVKN